MYQRFLQQHQAPEGPPPTPEGTPERPGLPGLLPLPGRLDTGDLLLILILLLAWLEKGDEELLVLLCVLVVLSL